MSEKSMMFNSGIPTEPDVKRLRDAIGVPKIGDLIPYGLIEDTIGSKRGKSRFGSVVTAWRKELDREHNIVLIAIKNEGYEVANAERRVHFSASRFKGHLRGINRAASVAARTDADGLTPELVRVRDHVVTVSATMRLAAATAAKKLRYQDPQKLLSK